MGIPQGLQALWSSYEWFVWLFTNRYDQLLKVNTFYLISWRLTCGGFACIQYLSNLALKFEVSIRLTHMNILSGHINHVHLSQAILPQLLIESTHWVKLAKLQKHWKTRRLANTKLDHWNLLLWISMKFWILVSTTLGLFSKDPPIYPNTHIKLTKIKIRSSLGQFKHCSEPLI